MSAIEAFEKGLKKSIRRRKLHKAISEIVFWLLTIAVVLGLTLLIKVIIKALL